MSNVIIYDSTGRILRTIVCPPDMNALQVGTGESFIVGVCDQITQYVLNGVVTNRPTQSTTIDKTAINANGNDVVTISNAPIGATCTISNSETVTGIIDGTDTFVTTIPGTYFMTITQFPFLDFTAVINAT